MCAANSPCYGVEKINRGDLGKANTVVSNSGMKLLGPFAAVPRSVPLFRNCCSLLIAKGQAHGWAVLAGAMRGLTVGVLPAMFLLGATRDESYNALWALFFGFSPHDILGLGAARFSET